MFFLLLLNFAHQGLGNLAAGTMVLAISARFKSTRAYETDPYGQADYVWRIVLMLGAVPALLTYYWRMKMPETARYTALIAKNLKQAASDMTSVLEIDIPLGKEEMDALAIQDEFGLFSMEFVQRYGRELLSTTMCWLLLDIVFYSLNLFMKEFFSDIGWFEDVEGPLEHTYAIARTQAIIVLAGTLPGYLFTVIFIDKLGRTRIQIVGFTMMTILMLCLAGPYNFWKNNKSTKIGFAFLYALVFFFANFGPNSTTFILPTEIFPTRLRSTCHGISGAGGKIGAIFGVLWFLRCPISIQNSLLMLAGCNLVGVMFTLALPESKGMSLEDITGEIDDRDEELPFESPQINGGEFIHSVDFDEH
jgi:PHS family inorganic phosphate transporter-like MFS transporter